MKDYYKILQINEDAEPEIIKAAYKALARKYHPDVYNGSEEEANKRMQEINEAYSYFERNSFKPGNTIEESGTTEEPSKGKRKTQNKRKIIVTLLIILIVIILLIFAGFRAYPYFDGRIDKTLSNSRESIESDKNSNKAPEWWVKQQEERKNEENRIRNILDLIVSKDASIRRFNAWCSCRTAWYRVNEQNQVVEFYDSKNYSNDQIIEMAREYKEAIDEGLYTNWEMSEEERNGNISSISDNPYEDAHEFFDKYGDRYSRYLKSD